MPVQSTSGRAKSAHANGQAGYAKKLRRIKLAIKNTIFVGDLLKPLFGFIFFFFVPFQRKL